MANETEGWNEIGGDPLRDFFEEEEPNDDEPPQEEPPQDEEQEEPEESGSEIQSEILGKVQEYVRRGGKDVDSYVAELVSQTLQKPVTLPDSVNPYSAQVETTAQMLMNNAEAMRLAVREGDSEAMRALTREAIDLQAEMTRAVTSEKYFTDKSNDVVRTTVRKNAVTGFSSFMENNTGYKPNAQELEQFSGLITALTPEDQRADWVLTPEVQSILFKSQAYDIMMSKRGKTRKAEKPPAGRVAAKQAAPAAKGNEIDINFLMTGNAGSKK